MGYVKEAQKGLSSRKKKRDKGPDVVIHASNLSCLRVSGRNIAA
jgi:hypothetical protein